MRERERERVGWGGVGDSQTLPALTTYLKSLSMAARALCDVRTSAALSPTPTPLASVAAVAAVVGFMKKNGETSSPTSWKAAFTSGIIIIIFFFSTRDSSLARRK